MFDVFSHFLILFVWTFNFKSSSSNTALLSLWFDTICSILLFNEGCNRLLTKSYRSKVQQSVSKIFLGEPSFWPLLNPYHAKNGIGHISAFKCVTEPIRHIIRYGTNTLSSYLFPFSKKMRKSYFSLLEEFQMLNSPI